MSGTVRLGLTRRGRSDREIIFPINFCVLKISESSRNVQQNAQQNVQENVQEQCTWKMYRKIDFFDLGYEWYLSTRLGEESTNLPKFLKSEQLCC